MKPITGSRVTALVCAVAMLVVAVLTVMVFRFARGPVGSESVVRIEVPFRVQDAAVSAGARVWSTTLVPADRLQLRSDLESKRRLKRFLGKVGLVSPAPESAVEFSVHPLNSIESVRCLFVLRGDHVMGVAVITGDSNSAFAERVRSALERQFPGYAVHMLRDLSADVPATSSDTLKTLREQHVLVKSAPPDEHIDVGRHVNVDGLVGTTRDVIERELGPPDFCDFYETKRKPCPVARDWFYEFYHLPAYSPGGGTALLVRFDDAGSVELAGWTGFK